MDKRIKELAIKAGMNITLLEDAEKVEAFAKLIAEECITICRGRNINGDNLPEHQVTHNNAVYCCHSAIAREFDL